MLVLSGHPVQKDHAGCGIDMLYNYVLLFISVKNRAISWSGLFPIERDRDQSLESTMIL